MALIKKLQEIEKISVTLSGPGGAANTDLSLPKGTTSQGLPKKFTGSQLDDLARQLVPAINRIQKRK